MITLLYIPHWLELIPEYKGYLEDADVIILEDPNNPFFHNMLDGLINVEDYIKSLREKTFSLSPAFPKYTGELCKLLKRYREQGKKIYLTEPYHELLEQIYEYISSGEDGGKEPSKIVDELLTNERLKEVYMCERMHYKFLLNYYTIVSRSFDDAVKAIIKFSRVDAYKILVRDKLRSEAIYEYISEHDGENIVVEAGDIHIPLYGYMSKLFGYKSVRAVHILHKVSKRLGLGVFNRLSVQLTLLHLYQKSRDLYYERLLAARNVVRMMLINKDELEPTSLNPYPRLIQEAAVYQYISKLDYDECKRVYHRLRNSITHFSSFRFK